MAYGVSKETKQVYEQFIIPFWKGKTIREKIFASMEEDWKKAFDAGIFTEFQEQRSPGHTAGGDLIYTNGFNDLKDRIQSALGNLDFFSDTTALDRQEVLNALDIAADAWILFANRHADEVLATVFNAYHKAVTDKPNARGGVYRINLLPTTCHVYFGEITGALPDGRKAGIPFSEGISPVQGADRCGPTAVLKSAAKIFLNLLSHPDKSPGYYH